MMFQKAERKRAKCRLALIGPSGSGKTLSALLIAQGIGGKIAVIDTESGSAELYADSCNYDVAQLGPPYEPAKYVKAIKAAEKAGYDICIVDSLTHAWAGEGGELDMVNKITDSSSSKNSYFAWRKVTPEHNKLVDAMLQTPMHMIVTCRTKTHYDMQKDDRGKIQPVKVGLAPVFRDGIEYEMTTCFDLSIENHVANASKDRTGLFDGKYFTPTIDTGKELVAWLNSGKKPPPPKPKAITQETKRTLQGMMKIDGLVGDDAKAFYDWHLDRCTKAGTPLVNDKPSEKWGQDFVENFADVHQEYNKEQIES